MCNMPPEPTLILDLEGLAGITNNLSGFYELGADIDLGGTDCTPLGNDSAQFTGSFNGNGHTISGLAARTTPRQTADGTVKSTPMVIKQPQPQPQQPVNPQP